MNNITMVRLLLFTDNIPDYIFWRHVDIFEKVFVTHFEKPLHQIESAGMIRT
jgi:hypothetical protein